MFDAILNAPWWLLAAGFIILALLITLLYLECQSLSTASGLKPPASSPSYSISRSRSTTTICGGTGSSQQTIPSHLVQHLEDLVTECKEFRNAYEEGITDRQGRILDSKDFEELCRYDALINNAELALLRLKNPHVFRSAPA